MCRTKLSTFATYYLIEFCQILWPSVTYLSYSDNQVHVHTSTIHSIYPKANLSKISRNMGYTKIERIKDVHQKGVRWVKSSVTQRRHGRKMHGPYEGMPHAHKVCLKKERGWEKNIAYIKRERRGVGLGEKSSPTHIALLDQKGMTCVYL